MNSVIFQSVLIFSVVFLLSLNRLFSVDWTDPKLDFYRYSRLASTVESWLIEPSENNLKIILEDPLAGRFLFSFLLAFLRYSLNINFGVSACIISFISGIISLWLLKKICSLIILEKKLQEKNYPLLVVIAFSTSPIFIRSFLVPVTDMLALCILLLSIWFFLNHIKNNTYYSLGISILLGLIGIFIREVLAILLLAYLLFPAPKKKKMIHILLLGIPSLIFLLYSLIIDSTILNLFFARIGIPYYNNNLDSWLSSVLILFATRWKAFNLEKFLISLAPLFLAFLFVFYRLEKISPKELQKIDLIILVFISFWALLYQAFFILFWRGSFVQRYWILNSFILFQIALLPRFNSNNRNMDSANNERNYFQKHLIDVIFFILVSYNLIYEISSLLLF